eukprot:COSAG01_NODE_22632_length_847_cov_6.828877_1_plen_103_part_10
MRWHARAAACGARRWPSASHVRFRSAWGGGGRGQWWARCWAARIWPRRPLPCVWRDPPVTERRGRAGGGDAAVAAVTMPHIKMQWPFKATKEGQLSAVADEVS